MIKKLNESDSLKFKSISQEEKAKRGILGRLYGQVASCVNPTRNDRKYSEALWENLFQSDLIKERFANGGIFGQLNHPDYEEVDMEKIAIVMPEPPVKDKNGQLVAYVDIVDTPCGRIAYQLAKYGYKFGISSRGTGDLIEGKDGSEVDPDTYQLNAFDLVEIPAVESARLSFVESLQTKTRYNKTLKESLSEELNKSSKDDRKIMKEALNDLDSKLAEDIFDDEEVEPYGYEALWFDNPDKKGDFITQDFDSKEDLMDFFEEHKNDPDKFWWWLTSRDEDWGVIEDIYLQTKSPIKESAGDYYKDPDGEILSYEEAKDAIINDTGISEEEFEVDPSWYLDDAGYSCTDAPEESERDGFDDFDDAWHSGEMREEINTECNSESCADKEEENDEEVVNNESEIVAQLQESLIQNKKLADDNLSLQEKLSVCNAKEVKLEEELKQKTNAVINLSDKAKEVKPLTEKVNKLTESLAKKDEVIKANRSRLESMVEKKKELSKQLDESLSINENLQSQVDNLNDQLESLNSKLNESKETIKKYQKAYASLKESYLVSKADAYGIKKEAVKANLNESYTVKDIDRICEDLANERKAMSKLPFRINEGATIKASQSKDYSIKMKDKGSSNDDDYVSDSLLRMIK